MRETIGNLWQYHVGTNLLVLTTNGTVKKDGKAVMGRGVALEAYRKIPDLPARLGKLILAKGNHVHYLQEESLVTFPVKDNWWDVASYDLIDRSCDELCELTRRLPGVEIYLPRPGCGNGHLSWEDVRPLLLERLDNRFTVVYEDGH